MTGANPVLSLSAKGAGMEHPVVGPIASAPEQAHQDLNILKTL